MNIENTVEEYLALRENIVNVALGSSDYEEIFPANDEIRQWWDDLEENHGAVFKYAVWSGVLHKRLLCKIDNFFAREGLAQLFPDGQGSRPSWQRCDCCGERAKGDLHSVVGVDEEFKHGGYFEICDRCMEEAT